MAPVMQPLTSKEHYETDNHHTNKRKNHTNTDMVKTIKNKATHSVSLAVTIPSA